MSQFGQLDEDTPVSIPIVPTNFIMQPMSTPPIVSNQSPHNDHMTSGIPPRPPGQYKKHPSDPTRSNPHLSPISSSNSTLSRSKSCGEGRSSEPSEALDVISRKASTERLGSGASLIDKSTHDSADDYRNDSGFEPPKASTAGNFKCNAFCMYLPGLSKKKPMPVRSESQLSSYSAESDNIYRDNFYKPDLDANATPSRPSVISKVASLERFDLSSVSSDIIIDCWNERHGNSSYFDLPMELIDSGENDTDLPTNSAFVFENDRRAGRRKKKSSSSRINSSKTSYEMSSRRSNNSRISSSSKVSDASSMRSSCSSACIAPKVIKTREKLKALVEAQSG
ncbi:hypothetical protein FCM35_KLT05461 [Carex littledalei]|uniref:Uncharacterized protein n=1 Tax=Carex littledalei TaxID=544730 RepID=A0A833QPE1_9POAL|nr:hypothetical protein FCM35_KLT05461 [Carex littledalei]